MITKEYIKELINNGKGEIGHLVKQYRDSGSLTFILENLGQIPKDFDGSFLIELLSNNNASVRLWAIKTIGKIGKKEYLPILKNTAFNDNNTNVRREAVSSIRRMRTIKCQSILT